MSIWSTPKNPGRFARQIIQKVDGCVHDESSAHPDGTTDENE
jgi:hypothetical protein